MLTGHPPYDGETPVSVAIQHINAKAIPPRVLNPQIPEGLEQITMHAMAANLDERYESATEMLRDLDEFRKNPSTTFRFGDEPPQTHAPERTTARTAAERAVRSKSADAGRPRQPQAKHGRSNAAALIAGFIVIALALAGIGYFLYSFFFGDLFAQTEDVQVPSFLNMLLEDIDNNDYPNFQIQVKEWVTDDTVEQGRVVSQDPAPDRMVKSGSTISLTISSGPSTDTMRDVLNYSLENAKTVLDNLALDLVINVVEESSDLAAGTVIRTDPVYGEPLTAGQTVTLYVSSGPAITLVPVPELLGLTQEKAVEKLDELGLLYEITEVPHEEAEGTVVYQSIKQGEEVKVGTTVNIQVSKGMEEDEDEEDDPNEEDQNPNDTSGLPQERLIYLDLPQQLEHEVVVTVKLDDVTMDEFPVDPETLNDQHQVPIALTSVGIHRVDVYLDGAIYYTFYYDFDTGEVVPEEAIQTDGEADADGEG